MDKKRFEYAAKQGSRMKLFKTEDEAVKFADNDSTIALYSTMNGEDYGFEKVVGIKTSANTIEAILTR
jgi:hypothetical protein